MKRFLLVVSLLLTVLAGVLVVRRAEPMYSQADRVPPGTAQAPARGVSQPTPTGSTNPVASSTPAADSPANWPRIIAFNDWARNYTAMPPEARATMIAEGLRLAQERRPEFKKLIVADPERALEQAVRPIFRQELPPEIIAELEQPVSTRGDLRVYRGRPEPGKELPDSELVLRYVATSSGETYRAHVSGDAKVLPYQKNVAIRGIALDQEMAVADRAVRQLERGERIPAGVTVSDVCPVSGNVTPVEHAANEPVTDETPTIEYAGEIIRLCDGSHVTVFDDRSRLTANIAASGGPGGAHPIKDNFPGTSSEAIGNFRALYIRCAYPDRLQAPNTEASAQEDMANVGRFYVESSYGRLSVSTVVTPLVVLPHTREYYEDKDAIVDGLGLLHSDARRQARLLGFDSSAFNVVIMRVNGGLRSGASWGGGDSVWAGWDGMDVLNHECGHSLGRPHANFWDTGGQSAIGAGGNQEYGNSFDVMGGGGGFSAHYNTVSKRALRWLPEQNIHSPTASGIYRVYAYDQPLLEEGKRYALKVRKDVTRNYYLEYHNAYGIEHPSRVELRNSALVIWSGFGGAGHLIDTTPGTPGGKDDSGIEVGRTFSDEGAEVHFTVVSRNSTSPESLDIAVNLGNDPANNPPTLTLTPSALTVVVGRSLTFTANATDADGDALAYHWDSGDGLPGVNTSTFTRSFNAARQHTIHCTVSDMKGGVTRRHVVVTVGSPGRQTVTGQVLANDQPLQGVILTGGGKYAYTDANGNYALSDLSTGALAVTPLLPGYSFTPNPGNITVVAGANVRNFTATPVTQVSITATADAAESGSNGNFRITRTGNTSAALDVRVMSASGSAVRGVDYSLSPDYTDDGNYRTFNFP
ncbi:MAG: PKD domain-containing protein, partial [Verrucomicrobia bacterium]|nr:PKD domain-containing protein [Verrucomicrobiota bacterium]